MKTKLISVMILMISFTVIFAKPTSAMNIVGESAILVDVKTGQILYEKNANESMYPASITKIMTVLLALEKGGLDDIVTVSYNAMNQDGSRIYLEEGEQVKLRELIYGTLLNSGNDSAVAIAEHLGGSVDGFVEMMNRKASELGMTNTHFVNPNGLPDPSHVSSAYDMSRLAIYALQNPKFREIASTKFYNADWIGENVHAIIQNHNRLLWDYPYATGMKTGYTVTSRSTIVASANKEGRDLVAVVLKSDPRSYYDDTIKLFDYGFSKTSLIPILKMEVKSTSLYGNTVHYIPKETPYTIAIDGQQPELKVLEKFNGEKDTSIFDQFIVNKGEVIGTIEIFNAQGEKVNSVDLIATEDIPNTFPLKKVTGFFLVLLIVISLWLRILRKSKKSKSSRKRPWLLDNEY